MALIQFHVYARRQLCQMHFCSGMCIAAGALLVLRGGIDFHDSSRCILDCPRWQYLCCNAYSHANVKQNYAWQSVGLGHAGHCQHLLVELDVLLVTLGGLFTKVRGLA